MSNQLSTTLTTDAGFELAQRAGKLLSASDLVPQQFRGNLPNCVVALNMAQRLDADPLMIMQNIVIVHGRPTWSSQFLIATLNQSGRYTALRYEFVGEKGKDSYGCMAWAIERDTGDRIDFQGLLLAGILISMLGVLDDISVSQASVVQELEGAKKNISFVELYRRTMNVGKDHIASMVNTLVLVYAGASIPLLLLFIDHSHTFWEVLNYEFVAKEIIQTLVGSIGLILTVPVTTFIACIWHRKSA